MTEYAGITIIVDQGDERTIINVPRADLVGIDYEYQPRPTLPHPAHRYTLPEPFPLHLFKFRPQGEYTIEKEVVPMRATPTPELSEHEQAEVDRFGIHEEDRGVW